MSEDIGGTSLPSGALEELPAPTPTPPTPTLTPAAPVPAPAAALVKTPPLIANAVLVTVPAPPLTPPLAANAAIGGKVSGLAAASRQAYSSAAPPPEIAPPVLALEDAAE